MATHMPHFPSTPPRHSPPASPSQSFVRRQLGIILGAVAGIVLSVAALLVLSVIRATTPVPAPDATARALCADLQSRDYTALYMLLAPDLQATGTPSQFAASQQELDITAGRVTVCAFRIQRAVSDDATLMVTVQRGDGAPTTSDVALRYTNNAWRIGSYDSSDI